MRLSIGRIPGWIAARQILTRIAVAMAVGAAAALYTHFVWAHQLPGTVSDWDSVWTGARALLDHQDPYTAIRSPPWPWTLVYPMPAVVLTLPFALLPLPVARAAFVGSSVGLLAFTSSRRSWWPLLLIWSGSMLEAIRFIQWAPLLLAAVLAPWAAGAFAAKPTTGGALFLAKPTRTAAVGGLALLLLSFVILPGWLHEWRLSLTGTPHRPPIARLGGVLLLVALIRWRRPEARLLAALALVPQTTGMYETLPLFLGCQTWRQMAALCLLTMAVKVAYYWTPSGPWPAGASEQWLLLLAFVYLPALAAVLRRKNVPAPWPSWGELPHGPESAEPVPNFRSR
jgi:hypothetical protein